MAATHRDDLIVSRQEQPGLHSLEYDPDPANSLRVVQFLTLLHSLPPLDYGLRPWPMKIVV